MCKAPSFTRLSSSALLPCYLSWTEFFPARTSFCRNLIFWKTKLPLSKCKKVTPLIKSKKQNSFYRNLSRNLKKETPFGSTKLLRHILGSLLLQKSWTVGENSMSVVILFASLAWKGRGERVYSDGVSHKRRFVFLKIGQYISSIYRYKLCAFETLLTR